MKLREIAFARSGDKNDTSNVGVIPYDPAHYELIKAQVTVEKVRALFGPLLKGDVVRYELPGIRAVNFVMENALGGGVSRSLALDTHGKAYGNLILELDIDGP